MTGGEQDALALGAHDGLRAVERAAACDAPAAVRPWLAHDLIESLQEPLLTYVALHRLGDIATPKITGAQR
jgi:hypothetical protein